jgi:polysaccharide export outer membrane protein
MKYRRSPLLTLAILMAAAMPSFAQPPAQSANGNTAAGVVTPPDYVIGPQDVLSVVFWREKDMSVEAVVRPDGKISLPLLNDVDAAGYTPEALRDAITKAAAKYMAEPSVTVVVKEIKSRMVSITGQVTKSGSYELKQGMTVLHLIAEAGGLLEYADEGHIVVMRKEPAASFKFNYKDVIKGKNVQQNIALKPGDIVIVP